MKFIVKSIYGNNVCNMKFFPSLWNQLMIKSNNLLEFCKWNFNGHMQNESQR